MQITENIKLKSLSHIPQIGKNYIYASYSKGIFRPIINNISIKKLATPGGAESMVSGLKRLVEIAKQGEYFYPLYSAEEIAENKEKKDVNLIHFPVKEGQNKPFVIVCAGGGYGSVASLGEGYPVATRLNELRYTAFCLTYQVGGSRLLPKPIDDLARAVKFLLDNRAKFGLSKEYIVCGFSAGGNLTSLWGTDNVGYSKYDLPKPKALFPVYPLITYKWKDNWVIKACLSIMFGRNPSDDTLHQYSPAEHVTAGYPPCYIVNSLDDATVNPENAIILKDALDAAGVPCVLEQGEHGNHGFGVGKATSVEGWLDRAIGFAEKLN